MDSLCFCSFGCFFLFVGATVGSGRDSAFVDQRVDGEKGEGMGRVNRGEADSQWPRTGLCGSDRGQRTWGTQWADGTGEWEIRSGHKAATVDQRGDRGQMRGKGQREQERGRIRRGCESGAVNQRVDG